MDKEMKTIYHYSDYRLYIKDYYETHKAANPSFSYRLLAQRAGINSAPFYKFIIEGTRNLTRNTIVKTCTALKLRDREADYFENLVYFNQASDLREKNACFDKLIALQKENDAYHIKPDQYDYFSQWYHPVIRELVTMGTFEGDYAALGRLLNPAVTAAQARHSVQLLLELGLIKKTDNGFIQSDNVLTTGYSVRAHQVVRFQMRMFRMAIEAMERSGGGEIMNSSTTISVSPESLELAKKTVREARARLLEIARADTAADRVYQLNVNLFPLSKAAE